MIQDIMPHEFHNEYAPRIVQTGDYILIFKDNQVVLDCRLTKFKIPVYEELSQLYPEHCKNMIYLFSIDQTAFFTTILEEVSEKEGYTYKSIQIFRKFDPAWLAFAAITGSQLHRWYSNHRYCGRCASPMLSSDKERALRCPNCESIEYPKISPAVIVGIINKDSILMSKYSRGEYKNYALIAGFMEIGETLEDTVHREVMEEVGIKVKNVRYYKSQPWGFSDSLLAGFFADLDGDSTIHLDEEELSVAEWMNRNEMPEGGSNISLTHEMIETFRSGLI